MIYSRFNERLGIYDLFEDSSVRAMNADLPVPKLPPATNGIGVPAKLAGRPLPMRAKRIGTSWQPRGVIVPSERWSAMGATQDLSITARQVYFTLGAAGLTYALWRLYRRGR